MTTQQGTSAAFYLLAIVFLLITIGCAYKAIEDGIIADEGVRYSVPAMKTDPHYQKELIVRATKMFVDLRHKADVWASASVLTLLTAVVSFATGIYKSRASQLL